MARQKVHVRVAKQLDEVVLVRTASARLTLRSQGHCSRGLRSSSPRRFAQPITSASAPSRSSAVFGVSLNLSRQPISACRALSAPLAPSAASCPGRAGRLSRCLRRSAFVRSARRLYSALSRYFWTRPLTWLSSASGSRAGGRGVTAAVAAFSSTKEAGKLGVRPRLGAEDARPTRHAYREYFGNATGQRAARGAYGTPGSMSRESQSNHPVLPPASVRTMASTPGAPKPDSRSSQASSAWRSQRTRPSRATRPLGSRS